VPSSTRSDAEPADPGRTPGGRVQWRFTALQRRAHPWLLPLLQHAFGVPVFGSAVRRVQPRPARCCEGGGATWGDLGVQRVHPRAQAHKSLPQLVLSKMLALRGKF